MRGPVPFTLPFRIGTDVSLVERHVALLQRYGKTPQLQRFLAKSFNRLEWPYLEYYVSFWDGNTHAVGKTSHSLMVLARFLAGRWAAKEAAIKSQSKQISMREVSILPPTILQALTSGVLDAELTLKEQQKNLPRSSLPNQRKPVLLINPPTPRIIMNADVARHRGLREPDMRSPPNSPQSRLFLELRQKRDESARAKGSSGRYVRNARVPIESRVMADLSISHDGPIAVATVLAATGTVDFGNPEDIVDDGFGEPLHEPEFGDQGFEIDYKALPSYLSTTIVRNGEMHDAGVSANAWTTKGPPLRNIKIRAASDNAMTPSK